jgi:hypothetical protein
MTKRVIASKIKRSSLGTKSATAARQSVSRAAAAKVVARAQAGTRVNTKSVPKRGG